MMCKLADNTGILFAINIRHATEAVLERSKGDSVVAVAFSHIFGSCRATGPGFRIRASTATSKEEMGNSGGIKKNGGRS